MAVDERIPVYARKTVGGGRAVPLTPPPVPFVTGEPGSNAAMAKARDEFSARGYKVRSMAWRTGGGLVVVVFGEGLG